MVNAINNKNFYPTPPSLCSKMISKVKGYPRRVLEPSAGKGDLVEAISGKWRYCNDHKPEMFAIELDEDLQATLRGKGIKVIDTDFLAYTGPDKFDLIIANPPFDEGDKHLLKAIDVMYTGQIIFLLNAETLRNPHTNIRKDLVRRLDELGAEIEYIQNAFLDAERTTNVEIALVNIIIDRKVEDDLFAGCDDHAARSYQTAAVADKYEVSTGQTIPELVAEYNAVIEVGTETVIDFYRNYRKIGSYLKLNDTGGEDRYHPTGSLTVMMQDAINGLLQNVRTNFWRKALNLKEVKSRLTYKKAAELEHALQDRCYMDFTESNIRQFIINVISGYEQTLTEAVVDIFDMFTIRHTWSDDNRYEKNIHYYNGWKTNNAFKVGKRVVVPVTSNYGNPFYDDFCGWKLDYGVTAFLDDIDKVMSYFDGGESYVSLSTAITSAFIEDQTTNIESTYFRATCHKKGTIHLTFKDEDVLRRFNVVACRGKSWLPGDFGAKAYDAMNPEEKSVVDSFEGETSYKKHVNLPLFGMNISRQMIGFDVPEPTITNEVAEDQGDDIAVEVLAATVTPQAEVTPDLWHPEPTTNYKQNPLFC